MTATARPVVTEAERFRIQQAATYHASQVWPHIVQWQSHRQLIGLEPAKRYLDELKGNDLTMYLIVMKLLSLRAAADWPMIRQALM